jgi:WD40 repeat protein
MLLDYPWLQAKLNAIGIADLEREFDYGSDQPGMKRLRQVLRNASHVLAAQPEQLSSQLLARWPTRPTGVPSEAAATSLRDLAINQLQKAGVLQPLTASLLASEALLHPLSIRASTLNALAVLPDGRLASGAGDRTIKFWDPGSPKPESNQLRFVADTAITALAYLPATSTLVAGDASGRLHWLRLPGP